MASAMNVSIIEKLRQAKIPEFNETQFTPSERLFHNSGRSTLTEGGFAASSASIRVVLKSLNRAFAVGRTKQMDTQQYKDKLLAYFMREADIWLRAGEHCNIAGIVGFMPSFGSETFPVLVFDFYPLGDLRRYVSTQNLNVWAKLGFLRDVAIGLDHLHSLQPPIVHRDLSASNVLLKATASGIIACINDFGSAKLMDPTLNIVCSSSKSHSLDWSPPEYVQENTFLKSYTNPKPSGDVWSFGCVFLEVFTGRDPWPPHTDMYRMLKKGKHPPQPNDEVGFNDKHWEFLVGGCWKTSPNKRYSSKKLVACLDEILKNETNKTT